MIDFFFSWLSFFYLLWPCDRFPCCCICIQPCTRNHSCIDVERFCIQIASDRYRTLLQIPLQRKRIKKRRVNSLRSSIQISYSRLSCVPHVLNAKGEDRGWERERERRGKRSERQYAPDVHFTLPTLFPSGPTDRVARTYIDMKISSRVGSLPFKCIIKFFFHFQHKKWVKNRCDSTSLLNNDLRIQLKPLNVKIQKDDKKKS